MLVAFDTSFLIMIFDSRYGSRGALDPRLSHLLMTLEKDKSTIIIPAPALSEVLIGAGEAAPRYLSIINASSRFKVAPFAERAAVEAASAHREAIKTGDKKEGSSSWDKVKYDRQVVSIAIVEGASIIYSNDKDIRRLVSGTSIEVFRLEDLPEPPPPRPAHEPTDPIANMFDLLTPDDPSSGK